MTLPWVCREFTGIAFILPKRLGGSRSTGGAAAGEDGRAGVASSVDPKASEEPVKRGLVRKITTAFNIEHRRNTEQQLSHVNECKSARRAWT